jgi:hypothetical protein
MRGREGRHINVPPFVLLCSAKVYKHRLAGHANFGNLYRPVMNELMEPHQASYFLANRCYEAVE